MDVSGMGPLGSSIDQRLLKPAGGSVQSLGGAGSFDPVAAFAPSASRAGRSNSQALVSLGYGGAANPESGGGNAQALLAILGGGTPSFDPSGGLPASASALPQGLAGYLGGSAQNPQSAAAQEAVASIRQFLATSGLNLLA